MYSDSSCGILRECDRLSLSHRRRLPAETISHVVWLYFHFTLSFCNVEGTFHFKTNDIDQAAIGSQIRSVLGETTALCFQEWG